MDEVPGIVLRGRLPRGRELSPAGARALSEELVDTLAAPHRVDPVAAGLADPGKGAGYVRRQVEDWTRRHARARTWNTLGFRGGGGGRGTEGAPRPPQTPPPTRRNTRA
ncbi:phosphotransferase, partial [Streptomyces cinereoruber]|uniref:phosphotransferase n=1 Tax=Streptomyces cinereoruber TaxID=67260 RepID=UPI003629F3D4